MPRFKIVHVVNRTTEPLDCMFDGIPDCVPPGYCAVAVQNKDGSPKKDTKGRIVVQAVPAGRDGKPSPDGKPFAYEMELYAANAAKGQHPVMGTEDPYSLDSRGMKFLLGVVEWGDECSHLEQSDTAERFDRSLLPADRQQVEAITPPGVRRSMMKAHPGQKGKKTPVRGLSHATDERLDNPAGIDMRPTGS